MLSCRKDENKQKEAGNGPLKNATSALCIFDTTLAIRISASRGYFTYLIISANFLVLVPVVDVIKLFLEEI